MRPYAYLVLLFLYFCSSTTHTTGPILNVSLVVIGNIAPDAFSSLPYIGTTFSMGAEYVQKIYANTMKFSLHFLYDPARNTCRDLGDSVVGLISEWHYRCRSESDLTVYMNSACIESPEVPYFQSQWNTLWLSTMAATSQIRNRVANPTWVAVNHLSTVQCTELYMEIFEKYNWTTLFFVIDTNSVPIYSLVAADLLSAIEKQRSITHIARKISTKPNTPFDFTPILQDIRRTSRVILFFGRATFLRQLLVAAAGVNMTNGEYVYFALETMQNYRILGKLHWQYGDNDDQISLSAFQSLLVVQQRDIDVPPNTKLGAEFVRRSARDYNFTYNLTDQFFPVFMDSYLGIVWLAAVLNETIKEAHVSGFDYGDGRMLARRFLNRTFTHEYETMYIDNRGERRSNLLVTFFNSSGHRIPFLARLATDPSVRETTHLTTWGNSSRPFPPPNVPFCGYLNEGTPCAPRRDITLIWATALTGVFIVSTISSISCWMYTKKKETELLLSPWWQICTDDLFPPYAMRSHASGFSNTADPRSRAFSCLFPSNGLVRLAAYRNALVLFSPIAGQKGALTFKDLSDRVELLKILKTCHGLEHQNICKFYGLAIERKNEETCDLSRGALCGDAKEPWQPRPHKFCTMPEFSNYPNVSDLSAPLNLSVVSVVFAGSARGNLSHIWDSLFGNDFAFTSSLMRDFLEGLEFVHHSDFGYHGRLSILNCWVDQHFTLRLMHVASDKILHELRASGCIMDVPGSYGAVWEPFFWLAPENGDRIDVRGVPVMQMIDIFSSGFILYDILTTGSLYEETKLFKEPMANNSMRGENPLTATLDFSIIPGYSTVIKSCLKSDPAARPSVAKLRSLLANISPAFERSKLNLFDKIYRRVCDYSEQLEEEVFSRTKALKEERVRCDDIIRQFIPKELVSSLRAGFVVPPEAFDSVTIMFTDLWGFADFVQTQPPEITLHLMTTTEDLFDSLSAVCDVYKVEAVGDSHVVASGLPTRISIEHVQRISTFALRTMEAEYTLNLQGGVRFRTGFHSGPCAAGVIGVKRPRYCLFGNTINVASRMCSHGAAGRIHVSAEAKNLLEECPAHDFYLEERGLINIKSKGNMLTYWLRRKVL